jgi:hypothetical protein
VFKHDGEGREQNNGPQRVVVSGGGGEAENVNAEKFTNGKSRHT